MSGPTRLSGFELVILLSIGLGMYGVFGSPAHLVDASSITAQDAQENALLDGVARYQGSGASDADSWREAVFEQLADGAPLPANLLLEAAAQQSTDWDKIQILGAGAEALVSDNNGTVSASAYGVFEDILKLDPTSLGALYYTGLYASQAGDAEAAGAHWARFLQYAPPTHPLAQTVRRQIGDQPAPGAIIASALGLSVKTELSDETREQAMAMTERLSTRLSAQGGSAEDWILLARSLRRLGQNEASLEAYRNAVAASPENLVLAMELDAFQLEKNR